MKHLLVVFVLFALPVFLPPSAAGTETVILTLSRVVELAAASSPEVRVAATLVEEEQAKLLGAQVPLLENPAVEAAFGPRFGRESGADFEVGVEVPVEWGRRGKRVSLAQAGIKREKHAAEEVRRQATASAVVAYYRVLEAEERLRISVERKGLADELLRIASERHQLGDAPKFDVNLARTEVARAESEVSAARGHIAAERAALARALGMPSAAGLKVEGDIKDRNLFDTIAGNEKMTERAGLLAAQAEVEAADAEIAVARADQRPDLALRMSYKREGEENVALAGLSVTLPFVNRKEGAVQEARVRKRRAEIIAETQKAAISAELEGARLAYEAASEAVRRMESEGLPLQQENDSMATESYRAGKINLTTLLQIRREALETRKEYLERLLQAAAAGAELASATGALPAK